MDSLLTISDEVREAVTAHRPVVALESSMIATSGSADKALMIEKAVREAGAVPATIGVVDGRLAVGLDSDAVERFATSGPVPKISARDLGYALAGGGLGATTVAGTLPIAAAAGIEVFATAGIGGAHRRAQQTFDISPDLQQFTRTRIAVVCAGAKSVLDGELTGEILESAGVPVLGYRTDVMPAFFVRESPVRVSRVDDLDLAARTARLHWEVNGGALLLTMPLSEHDALDRDVMEGAIAVAQAEADAAGVSGNAVSPFLMKAVAKAAAGRTAEAGRALLLDTAALAGEFAVRLSALARAEAEREV
jgi:pseudouridine-5'-phosphate glycosidase